MAEKMNYESMSALQLQAEAIAIAEKLRTLQSEFDAENTSVWRGIHSFQECSRRFTQRFRAELRVDSQLLYQELLRRTGGREEFMPALKDGMLAGPSPLEDVANAIERLSKQIFCPGRISSSTRSHTRHHQRAENHSARFASLR